MFPCSDSGALLFVLSVWLIKLKNHSLMTLKPLLLASPPCLLASSPPLFPNSLAPPSPPHLCMACLNTHPEFHTHVHAHLYACMHAPACAAPA